MNKYDWKSNIKVNLIVLKITGLWAETKGGYEPDLYTAYATVVVASILFGPVFFQVIKVYFIANSLETLIESIYLLLMELLGVIKAYYLMKNMKILKNIIAIFDNDWFQPKTSEQTKSAERSIGFWRNVYKIYVVFCFGCNMFWAIYPLVDKTDDSDEKKLPFVSWYPYDYKVSPFYEITYVYQVIGMCSLTSVHANTDCLILACYVFTACQIDMLCDNLRKMTGTKKTLHSNVHKNMLECISHHKNILNFLNTSSLFYDGILIWHLLLTGVSIGMTMYRLTTVVFLSNEFNSFLTYVIAITIQIFMYCWFADEVRAKSDNLAYSVFESDWVDLPENNKKELLFLTMNLTKPLQISALNLFNMSLDTYMRILKTAWSYFALLYQLSS